MHSEPASLPLDTGNTITAPLLSLPARTTASICSWGRSLPQPDDNNLVVVIVGFLWPMTQPTFKLLYSGVPAIADAGAVGEGHKSHDRTQRHPYLWFTHVTCGLWGTAIFFFETPLIFNNTFFLPSPHATQEF